MDAYQTLRIDRLWSN